MTNVRRTISHAKQEICRLTDNRFDRRYHSLTSFQKLVTMGLSVGSVTVFAESFPESGLPGSVLWVLMPFVIYATLTTLFARLGGDE